MNEKGTSLWTPEDTAHFTEQLSRRVCESLSKEFPAGLAEAQSQRLRKELLASLEEEMVLESRRVVRHFLEEEAKLQKRSERKQRQKKFAEQWVERLSLNQRIQHLILFSCTLLLILTGLPIKFHETPVADFLIQILGGPYVTRILHRLGAFGLTAIGLYHLGYCLVFEEGRKNFGLLLPTRQDIKDFFHQVGYFLGLKKDRPLFGRFSYIEKFDYWAVYWGMVVMIGSGYILWFMEAAINQFGKVAYDIAREAHSDEGLLATLAIIIWHFYNVHFNPKKFPGSLTWWHGKIRLEEFREEHPLEYEEWLLKQKEARESMPSPDGARVRDAPLSPGSEGGEIS